MVTSRLSPEAKSFEILFNNITNFSTSILDYSDYGDYKTREMKVLIPNGMPILTIQYAFNNPNAERDPEVKIEGKTLKVKINPKLYNYLDYWFTSGKNYTLTVD